MTFDILCRWQKSFSASYGEEYRRDAATGAFDGNMGKLPILQVVDAQNPTRALAKNIGQSHSICRFVALQHGLMGSSIIEHHAQVDSLFESCRDVRAAFYSAKRMKAKSEWFESDLNDQCKLLERAVAATAPKSSNTNSPWCLGRAEPTLADIAIYHLLGTPQPDPVSAVVPSFMDGESERVRSAYEKDCPRITNTIQAMAENERILEWEAKRPDTFT
jgi:glutathione S-transferase